MQRSCFKSLFLTFLLFVSPVSLVFSNPQLMLDEENSPLVFTHENWTARAYPNGLLLMAQGRPVRIKTLNGVNNAVISKSLQQIFFGAFFEKGKKAQYFIRFSPTFLSDKYLEEKTHAHWRELASAAFRRSSFSMLNYFEQLHAQLTVWQIEPAYMEKQLPPGLLKDLKDPKNKDITSSILSTYFWENLFVNWRLDAQALLWFDDFHIQGIQHSDPIPLRAEFLAWLRDGLEFNKKQSEQDGGVFDNLYMTTTLSTLDQQPSFTIDFGFKHLSAVLNLMQNHQHLYK